MLVRGFLGTIIGGLMGAISGAVSFGLDTSLDAGSSFIGATRAWWPLAAMFGAGGGALIGLVFGLYIAISGVGPRTGLIVGSLIGVFGALVLLLLNYDRYSWYLRSVPAR